MSNRGVLGRAGTLALCLVMFYEGVFAKEGGVSFKGDIQPLFNAQCVFCHVTGADSGGLNLGGKLAYRNLVNAPSSESKLMRVTPGKPKDSYLMHKLLGTHTEVGGTGERMPKTDPPRPLEQKDLEMIRKWIEQGAPHN